MSEAFELWRELRSNPEPRDPGGQRGVWGLGSRSNHCCEPAKKCQGRNISLGGADGEHHLVYSQIAHHLRWHLLGSSGEVTQATLLFRHGSCWHCLTVHACSQCPQQLLMGITGLPQTQEKAGGLPEGKTHPTHCRDGGNAVELVLWSSSRPNSARAHTCWRGSAKFLLRGLLTIAFRKSPGYFCLLLPPKKGRARSHTRWPWLELSLL